LFTPILIAAHKSGITLFKAGDAPSDDLVELAESGSPAGFVATLSGLPHLVDDVQTGTAPLVAGDTLVLDLVAGRRFNRMSLAAMLLPTNDSFVGLQSVALPAKRGSSVTYQAIGYDAGSETNDELCINIPGPQCGGVALSPDDLGEGMTLVSPGIQQVGDISSAEYDWRNPVAFVTIKRVR
jgi:hypothetical protein